MPIVLYTYMNPIFQFGFAQFHRQARESGVDGLLILDLPIEEDLQTDSLPHIRLIAPTTPPERIRKICERASGFIYYVSREGVTGVQTSIAKSLGERVGQVRAHTSLPIAVGFGISNAEQAREVAEVADAIVVGSAIVQQIKEQTAAPDLPERVGKFVEALVRSAKSRDVMRG
jgi:tryptophan synthase alpha chain